MTQHTDAEHPPALMQMFINSTDTLRHRQINQKLNKAWNDRPPLFEVSRPTNRFWNRDQQQEQATKHVTEDEDPNLLKGVS